MILKMMSSWERKKQVHNGAKVMINLCLPEISGRKLLQLLERTILMRHFSPSTGARMFPLAVCIIVT